MKKSYQRGLNPADMAAVDDDDLLHHHHHPFPPAQLHGGAADHKHDGAGGHHHHHHLMQPHHHYDDFPSFDPSMQLPQLMSADQPPPPPPSLLPGVPPSAAAALSSLDVECPQNLMKLTSAAAGGGATGLLHAGGDHRFATAATDWSILDKLLASHQNLDQLFQGRVIAGASSPAAMAAPSHHQHLMDQLAGGGGGAASSLQRLPLQYLGCEAADLLRFSK